MTKKSGKGKLIVIDGTDGSGKGTHSGMLIERLTKEGRRVSLADFPQYGKTSAYFVEKYLRGEYGTLSEMSAKKASLFYALDRYDASFAMRDELVKGHIIVSNRYVSSNMGHQAGKLRDYDERKECVAWLRELEYGILDMPKPDANILLYVPPEIGQQLVDKKAARAYIEGKKRDIHEADINHLRQAAESYMEVAQSEGWKVVDCMSASGELRTREDIHEEIYAHLVQKKII
jgi:dTMP kinase